MGNAELETGKMQKGVVMDYGMDENRLFERLMTVEDLAGVCRVAPQTVRNWVALRRLPFVRLGRKTRFRRQSIDAWLERKEFHTCR
jgi:excisionase family DNA binding protein